MNEPMKKLFLLIMVVALCISTTAEAKKYKFKITDQRTVVVKRSGAKGQKIVEVTASAGSVDKAIDKALVDAAVALTFEGAAGRGMMGSCPAVLAGGTAAYEQNKEFFDEFFTKGEFLQYVRRASNDYPSGDDNVMVGGSRQVRIVVIVDWDGLAKNFADRGLRTNISNLLNY